MKRDIVSVSAIALVFVLGFAVIASAKSSYLDGFTTKYGSVAGTSYNCNICHTTVPALNSYGTDFAGTTIPSHTAHVFDAGLETRDSDGDTFTNLEEIIAGTFPGDPSSFPDAAAVIDLIDPAVGTLGTELTIIGSGLGAKKGKIVLTNELGSDFGSATLKVAKDGWAPGLISATLTKALPPGNYVVTVYVQPYKTTLPVSWLDVFTINEPAALAFDTADSGPPGTEIAITGTFFGTKKGKVSIEGVSKGKDKKINCKVTYWSMDTGTGESHLRFLVPKGLDPGPCTLTVTNKVGSSAAGTTFTITIP